MLSNRSSTESPAHQTRSNGLKLVDLNWNDKSFIHNNTVKQEQINCVNQYISAYRSSAILKYRLDFFLWGAFKYHRSDLVCPTHPVLFINPIISQQRGNRAIIYRIVLIWSSCSLTSALKARWSSHEKRLVCLGHLMTHYKINQNTALLSSWTKLLNKTFIYCWRPPKEVRVETVAPPVLRDQGF